MELNKINTMEDVEKFLRYVMIELGLGWSFHPDDDFAKYTKEDGSPCFSADEAEQLNDAIDRCFEVCEKYHQDIYHHALQIVKTIE